MIRWYNTRTKEFMDEADVELDEDGLPSLDMMYADDRTCVDTGIEKMKKCIVKIFELLLSFRLHCAFDLEMARRWIPYWMVRNKRL